MKKTLTLLLILSLLIGTLGFVFADDDEVDVPKGEEITGFQRFSEKMRLAFTFNKEKKLEKSLEFAERRLAYAEKIAEENPELAEKIQEEYDEFVKRAEGIIEEMESKANKEGKLDEETARVLRVRNRFEKHQEQTDAVYARAMKRFEANNASEEKIARFEEFYKRASERNEELEKKAIEKQNLIIERRKKVLSESDEEIEQIRKRIEEREGILEERIKREIRNEKRVEQISMIGKRRAEMIRQKLNSSDISEEEKAILEKKIESANKMTERLRERVQSKDISDADVSKIKRIAAEKLTAIGSKLAA